MTFKLLLTTLLACFIAGTQIFRLPATPHRTPTLQQFLYSTERLKVMTWNVGRARLGGDDRARWEDVPHIADVIHRQKPDVVALQELESRSQGEALSRRLRGEYRGWAASSRGGRSVAVLLRRKHEVRDGFFVSTRTGRRAVAVIFELERVSQPIAVVSLHADPFDARNRRLYIEDIVWQVNRHKGFAFLAGDFNFDIASDAQRDSLNDNLTHDSEAYTLLTKQFSDLAKDAGATALLDRRLDYVFAKPKDAQVAKAQVLKEAVGEMDHQPVMVHVDLPAKARFKLGG
jgi:endonuclease/exonuclease/phosphatase family metal-dependent hydrolase